jgi:hypothetical protein
MADACAPPACSGCDATYFAPPQRAPQEDVRALARRLGNDVLAQTLLDGYPEAVVILNSHRQVVACNGVLPALAGRPKQELIGLRVGEVLGCRHADEMAGGCGTAESCRLCGAAQAMVECIETRRTVRRECQLMPSAGPVAFELAVLATALRYEDEELSIFAIRDISGQKRRELLERIFFHDALNLVGGIQGLSELVVRGSEIDIREFSGRLHILASELVEQIRAQRDILAAERGELRAKRTIVSAAQLLEETRAAYELHPAALGRQIAVFPPPDDDVQLDTDPALLGRVLGNLTKNALEASTIGQTVSLRCARSADGLVTFEVHNSAVMPRHVQLQLFNRSFSTKGGVGRGLGTFSVKLLTERYLGGQVTFRSTPDHGTTFQVHLPALSPSACAAAQVSAASESAVAGRRVLFADDSPDMRRIVALHLTRAGADVTVVEHGGAALRAFECAAGDGAPLDMVLLDQDMPVLDGLKTAARLRTLGFEGPVLLLTADESSATHAAAIASGCNGVLCKPIGRAALITAVAGYLAAQVDRGAAPSA